MSADPGMPERDGPAPPVPPAIRATSPASPAWPAILAAVALLAVGLSSWRAVPAGVWHDDGVYMVVGEALASGQGLTYGGVPGAPPAVKFPPGYSALLAVLWTVLPGPGAVTLAATLLNLVFLAGAGGLLAWGLYRHGGLPPVPAALAATVAFVSADVWRLALVPLSEPLFVALTLGALVLAAEVGADAGARRVGRGGLVGLAAVLALAVATRSAAVAVVAGVAIALMVRRRWAAAAWAVVPAGVVFAAWSAWSGARAETLGPEVRDVLGPYGGWLSGQMAASPAAFVAGLPEHALAVASRVAAILVPGASGWLLAVVAVPVAAAAATGLVRLHRTWPALPWTVAAYLGMLLVWPFADRRLVAPVHPLIVAGVAVAVWPVVAGWADRRRLRAAVLALVLGWGAAHVLVSANRVTRAWAAAPYRLRAERMAAAVEVLGRVAPDDAVVGAPEFWAGLHLHGGWRTTPSALFRPRTEEGGGPVWGAPNDQLRLWWRAGVTHVLLEQGGQIHGEALNRLEEACPGAVTVPARMPPQMVVALAWDATCAARLGLER